jgi:hypothetical protein
MSLFFRILLWAFIVPFSIQNPVLLGIHLEDEELLEAWMRLP